MSNKFFKKVGIGLLLIPLGFFLMFTFGEIFSGDMSGLSHLIQAVPVALLMFLAAKKPLIGGIMLLITGLVLGILYALNAPFNFQTVLLVEVFLFIPSFTSGLLLIYSAKKK